MFLYDFKIIRIGIYNSLYLMQLDGDWFNLLVISSYQINLIEFFRFVRSFVHCYINKESVTLRIILGNGYLNIC